MATIPNIFIRTIIIPQLIKIIKPGKTLEDSLIHYKLDEDTFHKILEQIKENILKYNFTFMEPKFKEIQDLSSVMDTIFSKLLKDKEITLYAQVNKAYLKITLFHTQQDHGIKIIPLEYFIFKNYKNITKAIDTGIYLALALKFTQNLPIDYFIATGF